MTVLSDCKSASGRVRHRLYKVASSITNRINIRRDRTSSYASVWRNQEVPYSSNRQMGIGDESWPRRSIVPLFPGL